MRTWLAPALLLLASCGAPVSWVVPYEVVVGLREDRTPPFDRGAFDDAVRARFGGDLEPVGWIGDRWRPLTGARLVDVARDGDLILVKNHQAQSLSSTVGLAEPTWYDHSGVLQHTPDGLVVLESWPAVVLLALTPDFVSRFQGGARATPVDDFLARYHHAAVLRLPGDGDARVARAWELIEEGAPFDCYHDPARPELSCTEFVATVCEVDLDAIPVSTLPDADRVKEALGWYVESFVTPGALIDLEGAEVVAHFGRHGSVAEVALLQATWAEIHRMSQREGSSMGDWLAYDTTRLFGWRPRTFALLEWAVTLARRDASLDAAATARELVALSLEPAGG